MNFLRQVFSFLFSKQMLAFVAVVLLGLAIWFIGPMISFGGIRPLAEVGIRVTTIVLLLVLLLFVLLKWPVSVIGVTALCLLIWHATPLISVGETKPFEAIWVRVLTISIVLFVYGVYLLYRLWQAMRANENLLQKILHPKSDKVDEPVLAKEQLQEVSNKMQSALRQLKRLRVNSSGIKKLFEGKQYLYELPWYMIVGSPGAGKTTALLNSGLKFPLAEQLGSANVKGVAGTHNCDWWFTNEAVLIDTAGRYVSQDSEPQADAAEWKGFLDLLRKYRPRAPINGAMLALSVADLLELSKEDLAVEVAAMRARMDELRTGLGIRFPIYVIITKTDLLPGFEEYFHQLTSAGRSQPWGFTLPYGAETQLGALALKNKCREELKLLTEQLKKGVNSRLHEEYDIDRRCKLYGFSDEFASLGSKLEVVIEQLFLDSKYDDTQNLTTLRGIYFTSGVQTAYQQVVADKETIWQRFKRFFGQNEKTVADAANEWDKSVSDSDVDVLGALEASEDAEQAAAVESAPIVVKNEAHNQLQPTATQSYFLQDLLQKLIFQEAHLVRPNLRWEARYRLVKMLGHLLAGFIFFWLASGLVVSYANNKNYLKSVDVKADGLAGEVKTLNEQGKTELIPDVLSSAQNLPLYSDLDLANPAYAYRYGLYTGDTISNASKTAYQKLQDNLLLPYIIQRTQAVMLDGMQKQNSDRAYNALRVYLMLHDKEHFKANDVRDWVLNDLKEQDSSASFGGKVSVVEHIQNMFDDKRIIQSQQTPDQNLINQVRQYLSATTSIQRLYERAKADMKQEAPADFTLTKAVGPQAAIVFSRKSGEPLDKGVSGLFTYDGYQELFSKRLIEFVAKAELDDAWVMGQATAEKKNVEDYLSDTALLEKKMNSPVTQEIRRMYLVEYATTWQNFLEDIRVAADSNKIGSANLSFELNIARVLASPDSPLNRLARAAVRETTLTKVIAEVAPTPTDGTTAVDQKAAELKKAANDAKKNLQSASKQLTFFNTQMERDLVDNRFAALREVVTGQADVKSATAGIGGAASGKAGLEGVNALLNEYYNALTLADNAMKSNTMPPVSDIFNKLQLEASKYPAPLNMVLADFSLQGQKKVNQGVGELLVKQTNDQVGNFCLQAIAGKYPFNRASLTEVSAEDFTMLFSKDGLFDKFFQKNLLPIVDTSTKPWRYKLSTTPDAPILGPNLATFEQADTIRQLFFSDIPVPRANTATAASDVSAAASAQGHRIAWRMDMSVAELDPYITELIINIDGQAQRYVHGPVVPLNIAWPGPRGGVSAQITAEPRIRASTSTISASGPWALFRLLDKARLTNSISANRFTATYDLDGRKVVLDISASGLPNPFYSNILQSFQCPSAIPAVASNPPATTVTPAPLQKAAAIQPAAPKQLSNLKTVQKKQSASAGIKTAQYMPKLTQPLALRNKKVALQIGQVKGADSKARTESKT
ncbi:type VI secretion system membrane subunit TssM [Hydromonas duriensis]|uniref:Type VI secretion system protein ImpL n=1 Tax=Hydromonas duriensis TaxID=1527608 RepID=A0A4R6Y9H5_9BURK|nr:type VI secretion system membrane subunit TssM [Hydromonas duriensis]TDR32128.1 type VI secretion system protein ImpL [Hydromonas duriensis]